jgi:hypothetical protein
VTTDTELLARDIHPADVLLPSGRLISNCRVFITSERIVAWVAKPDRTLEVIVQLPLAERGSVERTRNSLSVGARVQAETSEGTVWINRAQGCGCGSPLKALSAPAPWA